VSKSFCHFWTDPVQGRTWFNYNLPGVIVIKGDIPAVSAVVITASEWLFGQAGTLHRGDANIWVSNVRPYVRSFDSDPVKQNGGVEFVVNVDWDTPLLVATTITVFDGPVTVSIDE
jgi:hypothetical protein